MKENTIIELKETPSTNNHLKKLVTDEIVPEGLVVIAKNQKNGKGQGTNTWESEPGKNLTFSLFLKPGFLPAEKMFLISKVVSLAIIDYLNGLGKTFTLKWPNDIYYQNKKVGGILIENQLLGNKLNYSIIGIGLNINQQTFNSDAPNPISLINIFNKSFNLIDCLDGLLNQISIWYEMLKDGYFENINESYYRNLFRNNGFHDFKADNDTIHAKIENVEDDGQIVLKTTTGEIKKFYFKEIEFVL